MDKQTLTVKEFLHIEQTNVQSLVNQIGEMIASRFPSFTSLQSPIDEPEYLTRDQVAKMFAVSTVTIWDWSRKGVLKAYRIGNKVRYLKSEVLLCPRPIYDTKEGANHA